MTIQLPRDIENSIIEKVHSGLFPSMDAAMTEAARLLLEQIERNQARSQGPRSSPVDISAERIAEQLENLRQLGQKLEAMPTASVADGLSNRDHDRILYGK